MQKTKTRVLVMMALFVALNVVLARILAFQTPITRISFSFIPDALCAMMFGPVIGGFTTAASDLVGMLLYSRGMPYFPGFTLSAALYGITYGLFLYNREKSWKNVILCVALQTVLIELAMGTLWAYLFSNFFINKPVGMVAVLLPRVWAALIMVPIKIVGIRYIAKIMEHTPYLSKV